MRSVNVIFRSVMSWGEERKHLFLIPCPLSVSLGSSHGRTTSCLPCEKSSFIFCSTISRGEWRVRLCSFHWVFHMVGPRSLPGGKESNRFRRQYFVCVCVCEGTWAIPSSPLPISTGLVWSVVPTLTWSKDTIKPILFLSPGQMDIYLLFYPKNRMEGERERGQLRIGKFPYSEDVRKKPNASTYFFSPFSFPFPFVMVGEVDIWREMD